MRRALPALLAVLIAAVAVVGCGDSGNSSVPTQAEYKAEYKTISSQIGTIGLAVGDAVNKSSGKSNKQLEKTFGDLADQVRDVASKLDDTTPPANAAVTKNQALLVKGLNTSADDLDAISKAAGKKDLKAAGAAAGKLTRDNGAVANPRVALDKVVLGIVPKTTSTPATTTTSK